MNNAHLQLVLPAFSRRRRIEEIDRENLFFIHQPLSLVRLIACPSRSLPLTILADYESIGIYLALFGYRSS